MMRRARGAALAVLFTQLALSFTGPPSSSLRRNRVARGAGSEPYRYRVLVPIAADSEEIETACITDVLTRAGAKVTVASCSGDLEVRMSRGLKILADQHIGDCVGEYDVIALPGGMPGAEHLRDCKKLEAMLKEQKSSGRLTAAVCASPAVVFAHHGLLEKSATSYPAPQFKELVGDKWEDGTRVSRSGNWLLFWEP
ncbi:unnamed protein product [Effrenium voratum]|nr:unnamed protein product [Effrenium voratum]